ncbi:hypothetical protein HK405_014805 [Cladochytrium tenue]|nr:hypothetical protein HK405_014805 [Cladochytrium tenue]
MASGGGGAGGDRSGMYYSEVAGGASGSSLIISEEVGGVIHYDDGDSYADDEFGELVSSAASNASSTAGHAPRPPNAADLRAASANVALLASSRDSDVAVRRHTNDDDVDDDDEDVENLMSMMSPSLPGGGQRARKPADASFSLPWDASNPGADRRRRRRPPLSPSEAAAARRRTILLVAATAAVGLALAAAIIFSVFTQFRHTGPQHAASNNNTADSSADLDAAIFGVKVTTGTVGSVDAGAASSSSLLATTTSLVKKKAGPIKKSSSFSSLVTATAGATTSSQTPALSLKTSTIPGSTLSAAGSVSTFTSASTAATPSASTMRCGLNWATANSMCGAPCEAKSGASDCPIEQGCYAALDLAPCLSAAVSNSSAPAQSVLPSGIQSIEVSGSTYSLSISTSRCGASWQSADTTCGVACSARLDGSDCPAEQGCYADLTPAACLSVYSADSSVVAAASSAASSSQGVKVSIPTSRCGLTWAVANTMCGMPCEAHPDSPSDCPDEQGCYADLDPSPCFSSYSDFSTVLDSAVTDALAAGSEASLSDASINSSLVSKSASSSATRVSSRTASSKSFSPSTTSRAAATSSAAVAAATPTFRTSRCGTRWDTADAVCGILCPSGLDEDCPVGQRCFEGLSDYVCDLQDATVRLHEGGEAAFVPRSLSEPVGVVGYWTNWSPYTRKQNDLSHLDLSRVSVLNYAFFTIDDNATIVSSDVAMDTMYIPYLNVNLRKKYKSLLTAASLGGWTGSAHFSTVLRANKTRTKLVKEIRKFIDINLFDGVDIDYEYPGGGGLPSNSQDASDAVNFALFLQELRAELGPSRLLSIAVPADPRSFLFASDMSAAEISASLAASASYIQVMAYDLAGPWSPYTDHHAALLDHDSPNPPRGPTSAADAVARWSGTVPYNDSSAAATASGVIGAIPLSKLVLGVPFFGRSWSPSSRSGASSADDTDAEAAVPGLHQPCANPPYDGAACPAIAGDPIDAAGTSPSGVWMYLGLRGGELAHPDDADDDAASRPLGEPNPAIYAPAAEFAPLRGGPAIPNAAAGWARFPSAAAAASASAATAVAQPPSLFCAACAPVLPSGAAAGPARSVFVSYDDPASAARKAAWARAQGLAGATAWELSMDYRGEMTNAVADGWKAGVDVDVGA